MTNPIVLGSPMKSGTWLGRKLLSEISGQLWFEPVLKKGMDPEDPDNIVFDSHRFFSWHFTPVPLIRKKLVKNNACCIFIVRNIYAMLVSMYYHFVNNVDWEIGRGANKQDYFSRLSFNEGVNRIIIKQNHDAFNWRGIGMHLWQMQNILEFSLERNVCLLTYESLVKNKQKSIKKIAAYLGLELELQDLNRIVQLTEFSSMKNAALKQGAGSHFREGQIMGYQNIISDENKKIINEVLNEHAPKLKELADKANISNICEWHNN